jgi:hypothetical protein
MEKGVYITRLEWNELIKKINFLEEFVKNSLKQSGKAKWVTQKEAMDRFNGR